MSDFLPDESHDRDYSNGRSLHKKHLKDFFFALKKEFYPVYAFLLSLPPEKFALNKTYDQRIYWNNRQIRDAGFLNGMELITLREFMRTLGSIHRYDTFDVCMGMHFFQSEGEFDRGCVFDLYRETIRSKCKEGLEANRPLNLTPELIRRHRLKRADAQAVQQMLDAYNKEIGDELQRQYEALKALDCIVK